MSTIIHDMSSFSFSSFEEIRFSLKPNSTILKAYIMAQTGSVNSTCHLKSSFDWFSIYHTNLFENQREQNKQLPAVMSNNNHFILLELKFEHDSQSNNSQEHEVFSRYGSANIGRCVLFATRVRKDLFLT